MDGCWRERQVGGHVLLCAGGGDDQRDAVGRVRLFEGAELIGDGLRQRAGVALIGPRPRLEAIKAGAAIGVEPIAQRLGGDAPAGGARDVVLARSFLAQARVE